VREAADIRSRYLRGLALQQCCELACTEFPRERGLEERMAACGPAALPRVLDRRKAVTDGFKEPLDPTPKPLTVLQRAG
jgi:hypothetical protein